MKCNKCLQELPDDNFYVDYRVKTYRLKPLCKKCAHQYYLNGYRNDNAVSHICETCGSKFNVNSKYAPNPRFCSRKCFGINKQELGNVIINPNLEAIDGLLLGDLHLSKIYRYSWNLKYEEFSSLFAKLLSEYKPRCKLGKNKNPITGKISDIYNGKTLVHETTRQQRLRWYPNGIKIVPKDVKITPFSVKLWYLGDGSIHKRDGDITFSSQSFTKEENEYLIEQLLKIGITGGKVRRTLNKKQKEQYSIHMGRQHTEQFFSVIGTDPLVQCYNYKFIIPDRQTKRDYNRKIYKLRKEKRLIK